MKSTPHIPLSCLCILSFKVHSILYRRQIGNEFKEEKNLYKIKV